MGRLLVLYTQIDHFIMQTCADRVSRAPGVQARRGLLKQVGDESRHVEIQREWMREFGVDETPVVSQQALEHLRAHFKSLDWIDFLTDLYLVIEALGSHAVEQIVPLADPGTRESLRVPLEDELDHVEFGLDELNKALRSMSEEQRFERIQRIPARVRYLVSMLERLNLPVADWFNAVGSDYRRVCASLEARRDELLSGLAA
jgi:hypothetical protein